MSNINIVEDDRIQKRVNKILETHLGADGETLETLEDISRFFKQNTLQNRRNLRSQIEKQSVEINKKFLKSFLEVKIALNNVCDDIEIISNAVNNIKLSLESSKALTYNLIEKTNSLQKEQMRLEIHDQIAEAFLKRFQLGITEHQILYGSSKDAPITFEFFDVLDCIHKIHSDCRTLVQCGYQTTALEIMQEMTLHQEGAFERLYRWTQNHCRNLENKEVGALVVEAMNRLQERPVLFKYVIDEYAIARRSVLVRLFIEALTEGGPGGNPKPIEMHAHDSKRYIGDMFAWLHQTIPGEQENLALLLKKCEKNDLSDQIQSALAYIADGVCQPLKLRVEAILTSEKDTITLFTLSNILHFYQKIIQQVVKGGTLEECLLDLQKRSEEIYLNSLSAEVRLILNRYAGADAESPKRDLKPHPSVGQLLDLLKKILSAATMVEGTSHIIKIVSCVIDPLLQSIQESASHLPTVDMTVYLLNCLYNIQSCLAVYEYMDERVERLQAQTDAQIDTLTSEQASSLVANLNLGPIYTILQNNQTNIEINLLKIFIKKMEAFLTMPEVLVLPQMQLLQSSTHRATVQKRAFNVIIAIYKQIYEKVHDNLYGLQNAEFCFPKTPDEVSKILTT